MLHSHYLSNFGHVNKKILDIYLVLAQVEFVGFSM